MERRHPARALVRGMVDLWISKYNYRPPQDVMMWILMRVLNRKDRGE